MSMVPTVLWAGATAALAQRMLSSLFRRFLFRRIPVWEVMLQQLLFLWMVIYSLHFWVVFVRVIKVVVAYCYEDDSMMTLEDIEGKKVMQQWMVWMCGAAPLAYYIQTRPRPESPPLMIWITTNQWLRREMGPHGYYLSRPLSTLQSSTNVSLCQALVIRRAYSDSKIVIKEPPKRKRHSKSV